MQKKKKKLKTSARLGAVPSARSCARAATLPSVAVVEAPEQGGFGREARGAHKAHLHYCLSPVLFYTPGGQGASDEAEGFRNVLGLRARVP